METGFQIREQQKDEALEIAKLAKSMWHDIELEELKSEFEAAFNSDKDQVYVATLDGSYVGFAHVALRFEYVEGATDKPTGYIEGIFVCKEHRRTGVARALLEHCERWSIGKNCNQLASDAELSNTGSHNFHVNIGFKEVSRITCFIKNINI